MSVLQCLVFVPILIVYCSAETVPVLSDREVKDFSERITTGVLVTHLRQRRQEGVTNSTTFGNSNVGYFPTPTYSIFPRNESLQPPLTTTVPPKIIETSSSSLQTNSAPTTPYEVTAMPAPTVAPTHVQASVNYGALVGVALGCLLAGCLVTLLVQTLAQKRGHTFIGLRQRFLYVVSCGRVENCDINPLEVVAPPRSSVTFLKDLPSQKNEQVFRDAPHNEPFINPAQPAPVYLEFSNHESQLAPSQLAPLSPQSGGFSHDDPQTNGYLHMTAPSPTQQVPYSQDTESFYQNIPLT